MKKIYLFIVALFCIFSNINAQNSIGGIPPSFNLLDENKSALDLKVVPQPDMQRIAIEDNIDLKSGNPYRIGQSVQVNFDMNNSGTWTNLPDGGKIWRLKISCKDAQGLVVYYNNFYIPSAGKLFLYNEDKTQVIGAFTSENNSRDGVFATEMIEGQTVTLEYFQPSKSIGRAVISISEIGYIYRDSHFLFKNLKNFGDAATCHPNINCSPEGDNWQDEKKGVARILLKIDVNQFWCSGSLINNTAQDCKKYLLTADHCGKGATTADLNSWIFYFNFEATNCPTPTTQPAFKSMVGASFKAEGGNGGDSGSDFYLVELNTANFPTGLVPYFNGWNRNTTASTGGVGIHHPMGDIKKISTFTGTAVSSSWNGAVAGSHWQVTWASTANGTGVTEGGSSGSPLFDNNGRIIGDLTGGGSYCTATTSPDYYGKFSYSWQSNGTTSDAQLKPWLDPANTNAMTLNGMYPPCSTTNNPPVADFSANATSVSQGSTVSFTDLSTNTPTSWLWTFSGGTPSSSTLQNPSVVYNSTGTFDVTLKATNAYGNNTATKTGYINVIPAGTTTCDSIYNFTGTPALYFADAVSPNDSGYVSGNNAYKDKSKAEYFANTGGYTSVDKFYVFFGKATGSSSTITFNIRNQTASAPGSIIGTKTVPISTIVTNTSSSLPTVVDFSPNVTISGAFYFEVVLPTVAGDTLALISNKIGEAASNTGWEMQGNNSWYAYSNSSAWGISLNHAVYGILCKTAATVAPVANFSGTPTTVSTGNSVAFTDLSANSPTSWLWTFAGGTPSSSTLQNPTVTYNTVGSYDVTLKATNNIGNNTITKASYITVNQNTQIGFTMDFEASADFATTFTPWTVNDVDGKTTHGITNTTFPGSLTAMAFMAFNPVNTTPSLSADPALQPHGGSRFGASFATTTPPNNDWLISNKLQLGTNSNLTLWLKSYTSQYGLERYKIGVSTTTNAPASFTIISSGTYEEAPTTWTQKTYNLSAYDNQEVYIGINCVSNDAFIFMVDDIVINTTSSVFSIDNENDKLVTVFPNPTNDVVNLVFSPELKGHYTLTIYNVIGKVVDKINKTSVNDNLQVDMSSYSNGLYYFKIQVDEKEIVKRIALQK